MSTSTASTSLDNDAFWHEMAFVIFRPSRWTEAAGEVDGILKLAEPAAGARVFDPCCGRERDGLR
jgi:hypothetical protein